MHWTIISGAAGMLGTDLTDMVKGAAATSLAIDRPIDITDPASVAALEATDVIVNCAAYTAL